MSESVVKALLTVQKELKAPKGQYNSFGKYKYRSAEDILEAVKPLNADNGLLLSLSDEPVLVGDWHYIKATATITNGEQTHTVTAYARESQDKKGMDHSQVTGTASSYARKYALNGLYLIDDTKDADTDEYQNQNQPSGKKASDKQLTLVDKLLKGKVSDKWTYDQLHDNLKQKLNTEHNIEDFTSSEASQAIKLLQNKEKQAG